MSWNSNNQWRSARTQRKHIQSFVDRFRYSVSMPGTVTFKAVEKDAAILALSEQLGPFPLPDPQELRPPLMVLRTWLSEAIRTNAESDLRLDTDDRIALLGANGEGKSTLSKLFAGRLQPLTEKIVKSNKLRIGFFSSTNWMNLSLREPLSAHAEAEARNYQPSRARRRCGA